jgi:DNA-binding protein HU-beta
MIKSDLAKESGFTTGAIDTLLNAITKGLKKDGEVKLVGFGVFKVMKRKARTGRNPKTGEAVKIPARKVVKFAPGKELKEAVK